MSLDVYLSQPDTRRPPQERIFIRAAGRTREVTRDEWDILFPGREPITVMTDTTEQVYSANITHNLAPMARAAELHDSLWEPQEHGFMQAYQLLGPLAIGLVTLLARPEHFKTFNAPNGWGTYDDLVEFVTEYIRACSTYPLALVSVWR